MNNDTKTEEINIKVENIINTLKEILGSNKNTKSEEATNREIEEICKETAQKESAVVSIANYNCPGQIVITGQKDAVDKAAAACSEAGAKERYRLRLVVLSIQKC